MKYEEAITYIKESTSPGTMPGLERVSRLLALLGDPQNELKIIHVTGTNGKGSVCAMLESILDAAGYRTGLFTSPYIRKMNECIRLDKKPIDDRGFADVIGFIRPLADIMEERPTEFEILSAAAMKFFSQKKCDVVICETGMGARLDATNTMKETLVSIIVNVELDHMGFLGDTVEKIAFEKSGVIKPGCPVIFGGTREEARQVIAEQAKLNKAKLTEVDYGALQNVETDLGGCTFDFNEYKNVRLTLPGLYQPSNAAVALTALSVMKKRGISVSAEAVKQGMKAVSWPARFETLLKNPLTIYDGAHNMAGMTVAVESIRSYFKGGTVNIFMGVMADKEYDAMVEMLKPYTEAVYTVTPNNPRALPAKELADCFKKHGVENARPFGSLREAALCALEDSLKVGKPLVALGTLYMYEEAERTFRQCAAELGLDEGSLPVQESTDGRE